MRSLATIATLLGIALGGTATAQAAYTPHLGLSYDIDSPPAPSPAGQNQLDLYTPVGFSGPRPLVIYVHGGDWNVGDKANQIANKRELFTSNGYLFASIDYRLSPSPPDTSDPNRVMFPDQPHDVGEAIAWLHRHAAEYGGDPERMILIGHSAGAHLVSLVGTFPTTPAPGYLTGYGVARTQILGVVSLDTDAFDIPARIAEVGPSSQLGFYNAFGTPAENAATNSWHDASPLAWADRGDPVFFMVTQAASSDRVADNRAMAGALGQSPDASVLGVPLTHAGINDALGDPGDPSGETPSVISFMSSVVAASHPVRPKLRKKPKKRTVTRSSRAKVKFKFTAGGHALFECRLDKSPFKSCHSPRSYRLRPGKHAFRVRALGSVMGKAVGAAGKAAKYKLVVRRAP